MLLLIIYYACFNKEYMLKILVISQHTIITVLLLCYLLLTLLL